ALLRLIYQIWVFNLQASQHFHCFAFIVKRFRLSCAASPVRAKPLPGRSRPPVMRWPAGTCTS
ncbi:hypothetical protein ABLN72_13205, partial [Mycobacterium tuberculosis]